MIYSKPGIKHWYPSYMCSPWYTWMCELGYPQLDIKKFNDGSWAIIQYLNSPVVPSMTKWQIVLGYMENVDITPSFVANYVELCNLQKQAFWDNEELRSKAAEMEHDAVERHAEDIASRYAGACARNPALVDRVMKNGVSEILPWKIRQHVPRHKLIGEKTPCPI